MKMKINQGVMQSLYSCLFALLGLSFPLLPLTAAPRSDLPYVAKIDAFVLAEMQRDHIPGVALGLVQGDQIVHLRGFGTADSTGRAITPQIPFLIGSLTKSFTALAILQLVEANKMELDAPVQRYLPWFRVTDPVASSRITVRHLLDQTSGLPSSAGQTTLPEEHKTLEQQVRDLQTVPLDRAVGLSFEYANANYTLLGLLVQTVSGESYANYVQQHIFTPLHMQQSFASEQQAKQDGLVQGHTWAFGFPVPIDEAYRDEWLPAGYLISSAEDMSHYLIAQMNNGRYGGTSLLSPVGIASLHQATAPADFPGSRYAMGWYSGPIDGVPSLYHDGDTFSFHADMFIEPAQHWGAILLSNVTGVNPLVRPALQHLRDGIASLLVEPSSSGPNGYLITDIIIGLISVLVLWSLLRLPQWYQQLKGRPQHRLRRGLVPMVWEVVLPLVILFGLPIGYGASPLRTWRLVLLFYPDLTWWLLLTLTVLLITGMSRGVLTFLVLRRNKAVSVKVATPPSPPSLSLT
jgi:CubicO group peptidase (beta-lactamase class C family)